MKPTDIANEIIAAAMLRTGKDMVAKIYTVSREVDVALTEYIAKEREKERKVKKHERE